MKRFPEIEHDILSLILSARHKITPSDVEKSLSQTLCYNKSDIRYAVKNLIQEEELSYTYEFGHTFLEPSFNKPVRISKRVVIKPPERQYRIRPNEIVVKLSDGASFGNGRHPSTRLAVTCIEAAITDFHQSNTQPMQSCLDLGTGSGILVITALLLGVETGVGIDIDPNAIAEARENIRLNQLDGKIHIMAQSVEEVTGKFHLITANLRYTTLISIFPIISKMIEYDGYIVMSGIKSAEVPHILEAYPSLQFGTIFTAEENGWVGIVKKKGGFY